MGELINVVKAEVMSSLEIAEITGKRHCHVMRTLEVLLRKSTSSDLSGSTILMTKPTTPNLGWLITPLVISALWLL